MALRRVPASDGACIRIRRDDDLDDCIRILRAVHERQNYPVNWPDDPRCWLSAEADDAWVATLDDCCVGHVAVTVEEGSAFVERLFVDPTSSGSGIGKALLRHAAAAAAVRTADVFLDVVLDDDAANALYRREGWSEVSRVPIHWDPSGSNCLVRFRAPYDRIDDSAG